MNVSTQTAEGRKAHGKSITLKNNKCPLLMETWKTVVERCKIKMSVSACQFKLVKLSALSDDEVLFCIFFFADLHRFGGYFNQPLQEVEDFWTRHHPRVQKSKRLRDQAARVSILWIDLLCESTWQEISPWSSISSDSKHVVMINLSCCLSVRDLPAKSKQRQHFLVKKRLMKNWKAVAPITRGWSLITKTIVDN